MTREEFDRKFPAKPTLTDGENKFTPWLKKVNDIIGKRTGLDLNDLPDFCYRDAFEDGATPSQAARDAIECAKDF